MWGQAYMGGDKYAQQRAVSELDKLLPKEKGARMKALAPLYGTMPRGPVRRAHRRAVQGLHVTAA